MNGQGGSDYGFDATFNNISYFVVVSFMNGQSLASRCNTTKYGNQHKGCMIK
jgi:hypothetical protein